MLFYSLLRDGTPKSCIITSADSGLRKHLLSLCSLDVATGKLIELLNFGDLRNKQLGIEEHEPMGAEDLPIGLAHHNGHVWVSYNRGGVVHVAKIALEKSE